MALKSTKFRILVVLSIVWAVIVLLAVTGNASSYWDFADYAIPIVMFTAPVWLFWSSAWIWPSKFKDFFNSTSNSKDNNQWVYVEESVAQTHVYYGVGGWATLIVLVLALSPLKMLVEFYADNINLDDLAHISGFVAVHRFGEVTTWILAGFSFLTLFYLIKHKPYFQKMYLILVITSIIFLIINTIVAIAVFDNSGINISINEFFTDQEIIKYIALQISSLLFLLYVFKSKRINITTRKRLKKKDMHLLNNPIENA
jgi:hypothetical protein